MRKPLWWWLPPLQILLSGITCNGLFIKPPSVRKLYPDLKLAIADRLGVKYKGIAYDAGKEASYSGFALSLDAEFGCLDKGTFDTLKHAYGSCSETKSRVVWKEDQSYSLLDFLPPLLKAVSGLHFRSSRIQLRGLPSSIGGQKVRVKRYTQQEVLLTSNCWGFAWEVLFQADNSDTSALTISTADSTSAWKAFTGPGFGLVQSTRTQPKLLTETPTFRNRKLQPGDVLLIWHRNPSTTSGTDLYLDHVATRIDQDVYFEKSGSGDRVPFRISTWNMITRNFHLEFSFGNGVDWCATILSRHPYTELFHDCNQPRNDSELRRKLRHPMVYRIDGPLFSKSFQKDFNNVLVSKLMLGMMELWKDKNILGFWCWMI